MSAQATPAPTTQTRAPAPAPSPTAPGRDPFPDALKGFAIALVVLGHAIMHVGGQVASGPGTIELFPDVWFARWALTHPLLSGVYTFHMPLFAFVSGFVLYRAVLPPLGPRIARRVTGLLVPYFAWFVVLYWAGRLEGLVLEPFLPTLLRATYDVDTYGTLWFLYALFVSSVMLLVLTRLPGAGWTVPVSALLVIASTALPGLATPVLALVHVRWLYPFLTLGYLAAPYAALLDRHRALLAIAGTPAFAALAALRHPIHLPEESVIGSLKPALDELAPRLGSVAEVSLAYLTAFAGIVAAYGAYRLIAHARSGTVLRASAWTGKRSLGVYAAHILANTALFALGVTWWPALFGASLGLSLAVTVALERTPVLDVLLTGRRRGTCPPYPAPTPAAESYTM